MTSLNRKIGIGIAWNIANMLVSRGASVVFTLFLARFLMPDAFGLMAMVAICYALADTLMTAGLGQAIIRQKSVDATDLSTAFLANLAFSAIAYGLVYAIAPWAASFYEQAALTPLIRVTGLVLFINAFKVVQLALMNRDMDFKGLMHANSGATIVAGTVAVAMAYAGMGVWSLVAQFMTAAAVSTAILWFSSAWRPRLLFSVASFKSMFGFGSTLTLENVLNVLYENSYVLVIGKLFSAETTGLYYFAKRIRDLIVDQANSAVQQATYPAMARIQDENTGLKAMYRRIIQLLFFVIAPGLLALAVLAQPLFEIAFNARWLPAVPYLQLLCLAGLLLPVHAVNFNMLKVKGRADLVVYLGLVKKALHLGLLAASAPFGMEAILTSQIIAMALSSIPYIYFSSALIGYSHAEQLKDMLKPLAAAAVAATAAWSILSPLQMPAFMSASIGSVAFIVAYSAASHVVGAEGYALVKRKLRSFTAATIKKKTSKAQA
ncbi:lipopolysaccharide biosynthesis protein [Parapusillimonas sp. SGNA-6]|nr:lipopolysaccharide biosynthesis protein [Parapusillimonas sp. SGNA-6]